MKRVLITGAGSYIGTNIENWLNRFPSKYQVASIGTINNEWKKTDFSSFDVVIDVAGIAHIKITEDLRDLFYSINRDMTIDICQTARESGVKQFIFLSSMNVYGDDCGIVTDKNNENPSSFYGDSKLQADKVIQSMNDDSFAVCSVRPPAIYGKGCKGNYPLLVKYGQKLPVFPDYPQRKSLIFIDNLCEFIRLLIDNNSKWIFCPQNIEYASTSVMVNAIAKYSGHKIWLTTLLNPFVWLGIKLIRFVQRAFDDDAYDLSLSNDFDGKYNVVSFEESIKRSV